MFPQTTPILPSLPVKDSVLHQLHITDKKLPRGLACLKHTLLRSPSHTSSQESNTCTNSGLSSRPLDGYRWRSHSRLALQERLYDTIAESPIVHHGPKGDKDCYASQKKIFKSMSYLDQIAIVCLASGVHACQAPDCLQYREKLEELVPLCDSWLGLRDWVLCIVSCSLRTIRDRSKTHRIVNGRRYRIVEGDKIPPDEASQNGLAACDDGFETPEILARCRAHLATCILLTRTTAPSTRFGFDIVEWLGLETREGTSDKSGSIDGSRPGQNIYSVEWMESVSSRCCPRCTPEFLTCRRNTNLTLAPHQCVGLIFICKHLILHKREVLQVHQWMLLRFSSSLCGFETLQGGGMF